MGRVGLAISPQNPDVAYATIELAHRKGGFYRSAHGGETWEKRNDYISGGPAPTTTRSSSRIRITSIATACRSHNSPTCRTT